MDKEKLPQFLMICGRDPTEDDPVHVGASMTVWVSKEYVPWRVFTAIKDGRWLFEGKFYPGRK